MLKSHVGKPCPYCGLLMTYLSVGGGARAPSRDHVHVSRADGGLLHDENKLVVCNDCNSRKGRRSLAEWLDVLVATDDNRAAFVAATLSKVQESDIDAAVAALADFDRNGGVTIDDLRAEIETKH